RMDQWTEVYERHGSLVWATVYRILGEHGEALDCCQDVFAEVITRSQATQVRNWGAYLKWLATRRAIDRLRRRKVDKARIKSNGEIATLPSTVLGPDAGAISSELIDRLKRELARLPKKQAEAFWLFSIEQVTYEEIGEQLALPANQVGVLVYR